MSQLVDSIKAVKKNYKIYDAWEQNQEDDVAKRRYLSSKLDLPKDKVELTRAKAQTVFRTSDMMDKRSEDNCANMEQKTSLISSPVMMGAMAIPYFIAALLSKKSKSPNKVQNIGLAVSTVVSIGTAIGFMLWGTKKQKEASRIGRFQAKQHELKDPRNFVMYTSEQIAAAKEIAKNIPDQKDKKISVSMKQMAQDKDEYKKWLANKVDSDEEIQKIINKNYTPEQIAQGEEDKEIIVNIVKDVNMNAENYSENVENMFATLDMLSFITNIPIVLGVNKILNKFKNVSKFSRSQITGGAYFLFTIPIIIWGTHEKKQGSRVGRFVKRKEILDNPELIMAYSDEQMKLAKDVKAPPIKKGFFQKLGTNFKFFTDYLKNSKDYKQYKKTIEKENEKLNEALKQIPISDKQLKDAKNLQEQTFRTFDKMDEMSQRYSEDTEAATSIAYEIVSYIIPFIPAGLVALAFVGIKKGVIPFTGIINTASKVLFDKKSSIRSFVNETCNAIKKDKPLNKEILNMFSSKNKSEGKSESLEKALGKVINSNETSRQLSEKFISNPDNVKFITDLQSLFLNKDKEEFNNLYEEFSKKYLKQGAIPKWVRNMVKDILTFNYDKANKTQLKNKLLPEQTGKKLSKSDSAIMALKNCFKEYKTLSRTLAYGGGALLLGIPTLVCWAIASWMTNIQLKAGKIGIMKAMEQVDNPKLFVNNY